MCEYEYGVLCTLHIPCVITKAHKRKKINTQTYQITAIIHFEHLNVFLSDSLCVCLCVFFGEQKEAERGGGGGS